MYGLRQVIRAFWQVLYIFEERSELLKNLPWSFGSFLWVGVLSCFIARLNVWFKASYPCFLASSLYF
jgi:hypothetical protein